MGASPTWAELFASAGRGHWISVLRGADIVAARINTLLDASSGEDVVDNGYVRGIEYPEVGTLKVHGSPWQLSETPAQIGVAPQLGEHNEEILGALGYDAEEIAGLADRNVI